MTVADQLARAFETLTDRLRDDLNRHVDAVKAELASAIDQERHDAVAEAETRLRTEAAEQTAQLSARAEEHAAQAEQARRDVEQARKETEDARRELEETRAQHAAAQPSPSAGPELARLVEAVRSIDRARSLTETLDSLFAGAARESERAIVFVVRDGRLRSWRSTGFGPGIDGTQDFAIGLNEGGIVGEAVQASAAMRAGDGHSAPAFASLPANAAAAAVPIVIGGRVMAVLYADSGDKPAADPAGSASLEHRLELLSRHASRSLEALTALQTARAVTTQGQAKAGLA